MKNAIVTGATSFIGLNLIKQLINKEYHVFAVTRINSPKINLLNSFHNVTIIKADMSEYAKLSELIREPCDIYYSLAWSGTRGTDRDNQKLQANNYKYSVDGLISAIHLGCKMIISAGSQAEYGLHNQPINEETLCTPNTEYGKYKFKYYLQAFDICKKEKLSFKEPRFFSLYGPGDYEGTMLISILKKMLLDLPCDLTQCIQMWDYLYISDAINAIISLAEKKCPDGIYNLGSGKPQPLKMYIEEMISVTHSKSKIYYGTIKYPFGGMVSIQPEIKKIEREIGWCPTTSFYEGINNVIESLK